MYAQNRKIGKPNNLKVCGSSKAKAEADPGGWGGGCSHPAPNLPKIGKNMICWRKIVIFHTKYPNIFRASLRSAQFF
jgi:hypothetical protein